jgi:acetoin utilization deacetylase AcuC-like enzyme
VNIVFSEQYAADIGSHVFQTEMLAHVRDALVTQGAIRPAAVVAPGPAAWDELALVHTPEYLDQTRSGDFHPAALARLEIRWSPGGVEACRLMTGGTILAGRLALEARRLPRLAASDAPAAPPPRLAASANIGGGFHHAFPAHGEGFCLYHDVAVAIRVLQRESAIARAAVIDADVHQGNGTASIFEADPSVFTFSIHQAHNYPSMKQHGSLDVGLPDGAGDQEYLRALEPALAAVIASSPDIIFYLAGADPYVEDQLGGLCLTLEGLRGRDFMVLSAARGAGIPVAIVLAGGYARRAEDTVAIHVATIEEAIKLGA